MNPVHRISTTLLSRLSSISTSENSSFQNQIDALTSGFLEQATDGKTLASMVAGGVAYRFGKIGVTSLGAGHVAAMPLRLLSVGVGLGTEVSAFEFTNRSLQTLSPVTRHLSPNLWSWSGPEGWKQGLLSSAATFGLLKGAGHLAQGQNLILQHLFQDAAMITGHQVLGTFGVSPKPDGTIPEQLIHAEVMNVQMQAGLGLVHGVFPRLIALERSLDLSLPSTKKMDGNLGSTVDFSLLAAAAMASEGKRSPVRKIFSPQDFILLAMENGNKGDQPGKIPTTSEKTGPNEFINTDELPPSTEIKTIQSLDPMRFPTTQEIRDFVKNAGPDVLLGFIHTAKDLAHPDSWKSFSLLYELAFHRISGALEALLEVGKDTLAHRFSEIVLSNLTQLADMGIRDAFKYYQDLSALLTSTYDLEYPDPTPQKMAEIFSNYCGFAIEEKTLTASIRQFVLRGVSNKILEDRQRIAKENDYKILTLQRVPGAWRGTMQIAQSPYKYKFAVQMSPVKILNQSTKKMEESAAPIFISWASYEQQMKGATVGFTAGNPVRGKYLPPSSSGFGKR